LVPAVVLGSAFTGQEPVLAELACGGSDQDWLSVLCATGTHGAEMAGFARNARNRILQDSTCIEAQWDSTLTRKGVINEGK
jgi:hypothetical protein